VQVHPDDQIGSVLYNFVRTFPSAPVQARSLAIEVRAAQALGIRVISTKMYGDVRGGEWDLLPRLGYDAPVARVVHELHVGRN
jgi:hypothetical protein